MRMKADFSPFLLLLLLLLLAAAPGAYSQQVQTYTPQNLGSVAETEDEAEVRGYAGSTFGSPIAFGASGGSLGLGVFGIHYGEKDGDSDITDGSMGLTLGLGDPDKYVGLEGSVGICSLSGRNGDAFGSAGSFGFKLHTNLPYFVSFAIGVTAVESWGAAEDTNSASYYVAGSKVFPLTLFGRRYALVGNLGVGDNQFSKDASGLGAFGSLAFYVNRQVSLIVDDSGRFLNAGVSVAPFEHFPLSFTLGAFNLLREEGLETGIAASMGFGYDLSRFW